MTAPVFNLDAALDALAAHDDGEKLTPGDAKLVAELDRRLQQEWYEVQRRQDRFEREAWLATQCRFCGPEGATGDCGDCPEGAEAAELKQPAPQPSPKPASPSDMPPLPPMRPLPGPTRGPNFLPLALTVEQPDDREAAAWQLPDVEQLLEAIRKQPLVTPVPMDDPALWSPA